MPDGEATTPPDGTPRSTRLVIAMAYPDGALATPWFRAYRRMKRALRTKGLNARLELRPITDLPPETEVLILPPALAGAAATSNGSPHVVVSGPESVQADVDRTIAWLVENGRLAYAPAASRRLAVHRGFLPLDGRARPTDD